MTQVRTLAPLLAAPCIALIVLAGCANDSTDLGAFQCPPQCATSGDGGGGSGGSGSGSGSGSGGGSSSGSSGSSSGGGSGGGSGGVEAGTVVDSGGGSDGNDDDSGTVDLGGDADLGFDAVGSANVMWGQSCLYNFGSSCPFQNPQECGDHQAIEVTFPNGAQLLNATLFAGLDCSPNALTDNFNDQQTTMGTGIWMFTDDADVAGVSGSNPTSVIWWVGPLTASGYPPAGAPTTGCINYTSAVSMCQ
jgi:hypothetical protein